VERLAAVEQTSCPTMARPDVDGALIDARRLNQDERLRFAR
jgi:hypothetical protein